LKEFQRGKPAASQSGANAGHSATQIADRASASVAIPDGASDADAIFADALFPGASAEPAEPEREATDMTRAALLEPLIAEANVALRLHKAAEASGDRRTIADARKRLENSRDALTKAREEIDTVGAIVKALRAPGRLGSNSQWLR
jgi:hypothetical protein